MPVTDTDILFLRTLARFYVLTRDQLQRLRIDKQVSDRSVRKHLLKLQQAGFIMKHRVPVLMPGTNGAAPVYYVTKSGAEHLAEHCDDERYLKTNTREPRGDHLNHWIAINETRMVLEATVSAVPGLTIDQWINEWEEIDKEPGSPPRFTLHTQLRETPPLSCSPDAGFLLSYGGHAKVFYLEQDLATSSPHQIAARKTKGYAELHRQQRHREHFPQTTLPEFGVLVVTTSRNRCISLARELQKHESPDLWRMVTFPDLAASQALHNPIFYSTSNPEPKQLLKLSQPPVTKSPAATTDISTA